MTLLHSNSDKEKGYMHPEGFILLTYDVSYWLWVLVIHYDSGSFNDTEIQLYRDYDDAVEVYERNLNQMRGRFE